MRKIQNLFYKIKNGIRNIIDWFPTIWHDRDFDYEFLFTLMQKKLRKMEQFFLYGNTYTVSAKKHGKEIMVARMLMDRIKNDDYSAPYFKNKDHMQEFKHKDKLRQQDIDYLFDLMKRKIQTWWD